MRRRDLGKATPGFYVVDVEADLVVNADSPAQAQEDAMNEARRLASRTGRLFDVAEVTAFFGASVELCQSVGCFEPMDVIVTAQSWPVRAALQPWPAYLVPGKNARMCERHAEELRELAALCQVQISERRT